MPAERLPGEALERLLASRPEAAEAGPVPASTSPLFRLIASLDRDRLGKLLLERSYAPGEFVFREGESGDAMYVIRFGRVAVFKAEPGDGGIGSRFVFTLPASG